ASALQSSSEDYRNTSGASIAVLRQKKTFRACCRPATARCRGLTTVFSGKPLKQANCRQSETVLACPARVWARFQRGGSAPGKGGNGGNGGGRGFGRGNSSSSRPIRRRRSSMTLRMS